MPSGPRSLTSSSGEVTCIVRKECFTIPFSILIVSYSYSASLDNEAECDTGFLFLDLKLARNGYLTALLISFNKYT